MGLLSKGSKLYSVFFMKCPQCHEGNLYQSGILGGIFNMAKKCPVCEQNFELEPGFYWGAMYVSYGINSFFFLITAFLGVWYFKLGTATIMAIIIAECLLLFPIVSRLSRSIWINLFVAYKENIPSFKDKL